MIDSNELSEISELVRDQTKAFFEKNSHKNIEKEFYKKLPNFVEKNFGFFGKVLNGIVDCSTIVDFTTPNPQSSIFRKAGNAFLRYVVSPTQYLIRNAVIQPIKMVGHAIATPITFVKGIYNLLNGNKEKALADFNNSWHHLKSFAKSTAFTAALALTAGVVAATFGAAIPAIPAAAAAAPAVASMIHSANTIIIGFNSATASTAALTIGGNAISGAAITTSLMGAAAIVNKGIINPPRKENTISIPNIESYGSNIPIPRDSTNSVDSQSNVIENNLFNPNRTPSTHIEDTSTQSLGSRNDKANRTSSRDSTDSLDSQDHVKKENRKDKYTRTEAMDPSSTLELKYKDLYNSTPSNSSKTDQNNKIPTQASPTPRKRSTSSVRESSDI